MSHSPLTPEMERGRECIPSEKQLLLSLWYMATPECIRSIGDRFDVTKSRVRVLENTEKFKRMAGFPGVIGAIDGTHINIPKPVEHSAAYLNRKKAYSLILQAVCDPTLAFVDIYIGWPGSVHDARVFSNSPLKDKLTQILSDEFHLLGDGAYPLSRALLTPFRDFGTLTISEKSYNIKHAKTRNAIERAFGILKGIQT
ncbi:hypothetical protein FSP39_019561 [Pinctada imbricata]|uniref:DDE Tnp4 domain-containing protein n=1 Tax=Pinctada imbricata TaxID=66713 RepID=A0AA88YKR3_PINIB|nr:hypothetical protein FSP39_019561 [Pinctada imbricata]